MNKIKIKLFWDEPLYDEIWKNNKLTKVLMKPYDKNITLCVTVNSLNYNTSEKIAIQLHKELTEKITEELGLETTDYGFCDCQDDTAFVDNFLIERDYGNIANEKKEIMKMAREIAEKVKNENI